MRRRCKTRRLGRWLALPMAAALVVSPLPWTAGTVLASGTLGVLEETGSAETAGNAEAGETWSTEAAGNAEESGSVEAAGNTGTEAVGDVETETAALEELETTPAVPEAGEESMNAVAGEAEPGEGIGAESSAEEPDLEEAQPEAGLSDVEQETAQALDDGSGTYAGKIVASGADRNIKWTLDSDGLLTISGTGDWSGWTNLWGDYRDSITSAKVDVTGMTSVRGMFSGCQNLASLDLSGFDTSNVTDMFSMFYGCSGLTDLNVSGFDTSKVTNMYYMFGGCSGLTSLDLSGFDTSKVTDMHYMFYGCSGLTSLDLSGLDTGKVTDMNSMFYGCSGLTDLNVSGFDTSKVTDMEHMFYGCSGLTDLNVSSFDTSNVTKMGGFYGGMFEGCSGLTSLDVSGFDTSNVEFMFDMFRGCSSLTSLDLSKFNMRNASASGRDMLRGCDKLETIDAPLNVAYSVYLPHGADGVRTVWRLPDGTETGTLPLNLTESVRLSRENAPMIVVEAPTCEISDCIGGKEVTFKCATQEAVIYYSAKAEITDKDNRVENGGKVKFENFNGMLYARAYANGQWSDTTQIALNIPKVATPTITKSGNKVVIKAPTEGSTIYYTTDGSVPTLKNGKKADGGSITIDTLSGTVKAIAVKLGYANSAMGRTVLLNSTKSRNVSFVVKGVFGGRNVTFNSETKGAKVYYSSTTSTLTTKDKCVNAGDTILFENFYGTIYARTYYNGEWGNVCRLILKIPVVNTPTVSVDNKGYATIRTTTPNSRIYYTTDGSTPSMKNGKMVSSPYVRVYVGKGKTVKAIAVRSCFTHSKVATGKSN